MPQHVTFVAPTMKSDGAKHVLGDIDLMIATFNRIAEPSNTEWTELARDLIRNVEGGAGLNPDNGGAPHVERRAILIALVSQGVIDCGRSGVLENFTTAHQRIREASEAAITAQHQATRDESSTSNDMAHSVSRMVELHAEPHKAAHRLHVKAIKDTAVDIPPLLEAAASQALQGNLDATTFALIATLLRQPDTFFRQSDAAFLIRELLNREGEFSFEAYNALAAKSEVDIRRFAEISAAGLHPHTILISSTEKGSKMGTLRSQCNAVFEANKAAALGTVALAGGGLGPRQAIKTPFRPHASRAIREVQDLIRNPALHSRHADELSDLFRTTDSVIVQGGAAYQLGDAPEKQKVEYWVNIFNSDGNIMYKADFSALAEVLIEMRDKVQVSNAAVKRVLTHMKTRYDAKPNRGPRGGGVTDADDLRRDNANLRNQVNQLKAQLAEADKQKAALIAKGKKLDPNF